MIGIYNNLNGSVGYFDYYNSTMQRIIQNKRVFPFEIQPVNVIEPLHDLELIEIAEFDNPIQIPFDFSQVSKLFQGVMPNKIENKFSTELPIDLNVGLVGTPLAEQQEKPGKQKIDTEELLHPYTLDENGVSRVATQGRKVTAAELSEKYKCSTCESREKALKGLKKADTFEKKDINRIKKFVGNLVRKPEYLQDMSFSYEI